MLQCWCCWILHSLNVVSDSRALTLICIFFFLELVSRSYISECVWFQIFIAIILKTSPSDCFTQHNYFAEKICLYDDFILFACQHCFLNIISCVMMSLHSWCTVCTQCSCECVDLSWEFLNHTCIKLFFKFIAVKEKQTQLFVKIICLQKVLNQSQNHTEQKISYLAEELADDNDETENENSFSMSQLINSMLLFFWKSIFISSQNIKAFSHSSWGCLWILRCFLKYCILFTWWNNKIFC